MTENGVDTQAVIGALRDKLKTRDLSGVIADAKMFLEDPSLNQGAVHEALAILGEGLRERGQTELALACLRELTYLDPANPRGWRLWSELEARHGSRSMSRRIVSAGRRILGADRELDMIDTILGRPTVSACMIVKNEESSLSRCLSSIRNFCDEIIVVDTGSTDATIAIAESYGCKVFHQPWDGNFSKPRNYSMELATCDWIMIIDADEELVSADEAKLRRYIDQDTHPLLSVTVYNKATRCGKTTTFLPSPRLFRRSLGLRYSGVVHNRLGIDPATAHLRCDVGFMHYGYDLEPEKMKVKHERSRALLEKQLEETPDFPPAHFNLAQLLRAQYNFRDEESREAVLHHARRAIELTNPTDLEYGGIHIMALHQAATALYASRDFSGAVAYCERALAVKVDYLDPMLTLGHIYMQTEEWSQAKESFQKYLATQGKYNEHHETTGVIVVNLNSTHNAYYNLGLIAEAAGDWKAARECYEQSIAAADDYLDAHSRLGWACIKIGDLCAATRAFERQKELNAMEPAAYGGLAEIAISEGKVDLALRTLESGIEVASVTNVLTARLAAVYSAQGEQEQALSAYQRGIERYPNDDMLRRMRGDLYLSMRHHELAREDFAVACNSSPNDADINMSLGHCHLLVGDNNSAVTAYLCALELNPRLAVARRNLGIAHGRLGRLDECAQELGKYVASCKTDAEAMFILAGLRIRQGDNDAARVIYEDVLRANPSNVEALVGISDLYYLSGHTQAAAAGYKQALALKPDHAQAQERLSAIASAGAKQ